MKQFKMYRRLVLSLLVLLLGTTHGHRGRMNPMEPADMQSESEEEAPPKNIKASTSEVMDLLAEDELRSQPNSSSKHPTAPATPEGSKMDCSKITMQMFQVLLQNPDTVDPEDYSCGLLHLISQFEKNNARMRAIETSLHTATTTIKTLETNLETEISKTQFLMRELNETMHKETERSIKAENVIARRVLSEKTRVDGMQKNMTDLLSASLEQLKEFDSAIKNIEQSFLHNATSEPVSSFTPAPSLLSVPPAQTMAAQSAVSDKDIVNIETKISSLQQFIQDLSSRVTHMEDGTEDGASKGIAQIFKTYASLANDIEKEAERATGEEGKLKELITTEIASLGKQISAIQDRITDEKNRVQIIENRRTADLFEEINRAKSEESRIAVKLKEEMSKAASAFKRLELHVDTQLNSSRGFEDELKICSDNATRMIADSEHKLMEQINLERTRAATAESSIKSKLETEMHRAVGAENEVKTILNEEKDKFRAAAQDLKQAIEVEMYRAKGVELSIAGQITSEAERAKQEEYHLSEQLSSNVTRIMADIIKEATRAQNSELELYEKINNEVSRASVAEQSLLENINAELVRASDKEQELHALIKTQDGNTKVADQFRILLEKEAARARNAESELGNQISGEVTRAKTSEEKLHHLVVDEVSRAKNLAMNLTQTTNDVLRSTKELELEVRKTVMAEQVSRLDGQNNLKQQILAEAERARGAEQLLSQGTLGNYSDIGHKMQEMMKEIERDSLRLEDISLQISRNLTGDILTLAELFDDKLDDLERSENVRLKKIEDDMKKCCSGSSWRWRSQKGKATPSSAAGTVINKLMQVFGASKEEEDPEAPTTPVQSKKASRKGTNFGRRKESYTSGRSMGDDVPFVVEEAESAQMIPVLNSSSIKVEAIPEYQNTTAPITHLPSVKANVQPATNETVVYIHSKAVIPNDASDKGAPKKVPRKRPFRSSRRAVDNRGRSSIKDSLVSIQKVNSKVTSTFG